VVVQGEFDTVANNTQALSQYSTQIFQISSFERIIMKSVPPPMPLTQCLWTFFGIAFTLIVLAGVDQLLVEKTSGHLSLVLPPIGETC
jgi:hypothetical protein